MTKSIYKLVPWALNFFRNQEDFVRLYPVRYWISLIAFWIIPILVGFKFSLICGLITFGLVAFIGVILNAISRKSYIAVSPPWVNRKFMENSGDLRDDIDDAWSSEKNAGSAEKVLQYFFDLQNRKDLQVVILSGDIHAAGYSTIHSLKFDHGNRSVIPHIVSSPVGYAPFSWVLEAIYRARSKNVDLGTSGQFFAQISHHFTRRNVAVISIRPGESGQILKVKYYVEGFPEPQIMVFDLGKTSHLEKINWIQK